MSAPGIFWRLADQNLKERNSNEWQGLVSIEYHYKYNFSVFKICFVSPVSY